MLRLDNTLLGSRNGLPLAASLPLTPAPLLPLVLAPLLVGVAPTLLSSTGALTCGAVLQAPRNATAIAANRNLVMGFLQGNRVVFIAGAGPRRAREHQGPARTGAALRGHHSTRRPMYHGRRSRSRRGSSCRWARSTDFRRRDPASTPASVVSRNP